MVNIAALSSIPTTLLEKHTGFWAAYLLPTAILIIASIPAIVWHKKLGKFKIVNKTANEFNILTKCI